MTATQELPRKGPLEKFLSLFSDVRPGEAGLCLLLALQVFLLLASYYMVKTVRESLILSENSAEIKSYAGAGQAALLLVLVPIYSFIASRVNRLRLIMSINLFFASNLVLFYFLGISGIKIGVWFFLWVGIFNLVIVAQFWSFANDLYNESQGKRLFPIIGFGASFGAVAGAFAAERVFPLLGPYPLMLVCAAGLLVCLPMTYWAHYRDPNAASKKGADAPIGGTDGFRLVMAQRYLLLIALLTVVLNITNSIGEFLFGKLVSEHAKELIAAGAANGLSAKQLIGQTYGEFFFWVNLLGMMFQLFLVSRLFRYINVRGALFVLPLVALGSYSLIALMPILSIVRIGKTLENATDYSIQKTTSQALFLPTSREVKYQAKAAIDTFFWRAGDFLQALVVKLAVAWELSIQQVSMLNVGIICVWLVIAYLIFQEHKRITGEGTSASSKDQEQRPTRLQPSGQPMPS